MYSYSSLLLYFFVKFIVNVSHCICIVFQATAKRQFAAQASVAKTDRELVKSEPLKVSTLSNGLTIASIENHSPVTTLGVVIKVN